MKSTKKETLKMVILFPVIFGHGHFRSWSFPVMVISGHGHFQLRLFSLYITFFAAFLYKSMKFFIILAYNSDFLSKFAKDMLHSANHIGKEF